MSLVFRISLFSFGLYKQCTQQNRSDLPLSFLSLSLSLTVAEQAESIDNPMHEAAKRGE